MLRSGSRYQSASFFGFWQRQEVTREAATVERFHSNWVAFKVQQRTTVKAFLLEKGHFLWLHSLHRVECQLWRRYRDSSCCSLAPFRHFKAAIAAPQARLCNFSIFFFFFSFFHLEGPSFENIFHGLFPRWMREINLNNLTRRSFYCATFVAVVK